MALTITLTPGYTFTGDETVTPDKLNAAANPTVELEGSISSASVADGSITTAKLATSALSADATGRSKMDDQFVVAAKLGSDVAGDGLQGGAGSAIALYPDSLTLETSGGKARIKSTGAGVIAAGRNVIVQNNAVTPLSKVTVTADELQLKDSSNNPFLASSVNVTADITASGANGLDTGAEAGSTWYYIWVIGKTDGSGVAALLSASSSAPTMPATYTYKALVGAVRNGIPGGTTTDFMTFYQQDREVFLNDTNVFTSKAAAAGNTYESYSAGGGGSDVALTTLVPPIAKRLRGTLGNSTGTNQGIAIAADANGLGATTVVASNANGSAVNSFSVAAAFMVPLKTAQTFYWKSNDTSARNRVSVSGYAI